jgi:hypothetical protein
VGSQHPGTGLEQHILARGAWTPPYHWSLVAPVPTHPFNLSIHMGSFPTAFNSPSITPLLKKPGFDPLDVKSYWPISNLSVISKLLERLVSKHLVCYLSTNGLLPDLQSAYMFTALLHVVADILSALDSGNFALLVLLYLSAAVDSVDRDSLVTRLSQSYGLSGSALLGFSPISAVAHSLFVFLPQSVPFPVPCRVPEGSVLGAILLLLYNANLLSLMKRHLLSSHAYANDT